MTSHPIQPCVWLDDQAEQAAAFYVRIFPRSRIIAASHYPGGGRQPEWQAARHLPVSSRPDQRAKPEGVTPLDPGSVAPAA